jgi:hypothetical protein
VEVPRNPTKLLIRHAACAGALRACARLHPEAARGLIKAADFHSAKAATFADDICAQAAGKPTWALS